MYVLNNESILNIIKLSNTILTLSKDENNLSLPILSLIKEKLNYHLQNIMNHLLDI